MMQSFDSVLIGEALVGEGAEIAHIDLVIGRKGSYVEQAFVNALASPAMGHTPLLAVLEPNLPAKPATLMVNKVTIRGANQAVLIFGPAQAAVAKAVVDCVAEGTIPQDLAEDLMIMSQCSSSGMQRTRTRSMISTTGPRKRPSSARQQESPRSLRFWPERTLQSIRLDEFRLGLFSDKWPRRAVASQAGRNWRLQKTGSISDLQKIHMRNVKERFINGPSGFLS